MRQVVNLNCFNVFTKNPQKTFIGHFYAFLLNLSPALGLWGGIEVYLRRIDVDKAINLHGCFLVLHRKILKSNIGKI